MLSEAVKCWWWKTCHCCCCYWWGADQSCGSTMSRCCCRDVFATNWPLVHWGESPYRQVSQISITDDDAPINRKLPKELLLRIFSFLDVVTLCRCAQVSKYWNLLALDGSNWQRVDLFQFQVDVKAPVVENISKRCGGFLKALSLKGCQNITDDALQKFAEQCRNIEELNFDKCKNLTDLTCKSLGHHSKKLVHLDLTSCPSMTDEALKAISEGCHNLEHINVSWCSEISNDGLEALARGCLKLQDFICKGNNQITDVGVGHIAQHCKNIRRIDLHSCQNVTDESLQLIGEYCHSLQFLCVSYCQRLTDNSLLSIGTGCPALSTLEVACCSHLTDNGFQALARNCSQLERMDLEECIQITDTTLHYLASHCHQLTALTLSHCELITDEGIRHLGSSPCATEHLTVLELDNCPLVTDASLEHLRGCQCLERIELYDCQLITRQGIRRLEAHLPNIKVHAYFPPVTPPASVGGGRQRYCKCCVILWPWFYNRDPDLWLLHHKMLHSLRFWISVIRSDNHQSQRKAIIQVFNMTHCTFNIFWLSVIQPNGHSQINVVVWVSKTEKILCCAPIFWPSDGFISFHSRSNMFQTWYGRLSCHSMMYIVLFIGI